MRGLGESDCDCDCDSDCGRVVAPIATGGITRASGGTCGERQGQFNVWQARFGHFALFACISLYHLDAGT